jgi:ABC-type glycerol-3-phosphate transport system substrate-binding protein
MRDLGKNLLIVALACGLSVGLAACGDDDETNASKKEKIGGTVTVWDVVYKAFPDSTKAADQLDAEFERLHPGVTVKHVAQPLTKYAQVLQAAFTGRKGPQVMMLLAGTGGTGIQRWTKGLENPEDQITDEQRENLTGWGSCSEEFDANGAENGRAYGIPVGTQSFVFYYNKKLFKQAGLPTDFQPTSWDEVKEAGEKLKAAGIQPFTGGNKEGVTNSLWLAAGWPTVSTQEKSVGLSTGETSFEDPDFARALGPEQMMVDAGLYPDDWFSVPLFPDGEARFPDGEGAMFLGFISVTGHYYNSIPKLGEKNVGLFWPPGGRYIGIEANWCWAVPSFAENKEAAWAYVDFVTNKAAMETLYEVGKTLPNDKTIEVAPDAPVQERQILEDLRSRDVFQTTHAMLPGAVFDQFYTTFNEVLQGRKSMKEFQEELQQTAEKEH